MDLVTIQTHLNSNKLKSFSISDRQNEAFRNLRKHESSFGLRRITSSKGGFKFDGETKEIYFRTIHTKNSFTVNGKTYFNVKFNASFSLKNVKLFMKMVTS